VYRCTDVDIEVFGTSGAAVRLLGLFPRVGFHCNRDFMPANLGMNSYGLK